VALQVPGLILLASAAGFGALARDSGLSLGNANLMMGALFALPAQVVMLDQLARGGSLIGAALAVCLIGVRLLPMSVVLAPFLGGRRANGWGKVVAVHAVAVTGWIEGFRRLPGTPQHLQLPHFLGIGGGLIVAGLLGTTAGYLLAGVVPPAVSAALLFLTPIYFMLSLFQTASGVGDWLAIAVGAVLGPLAFLLMPGFDLLLTGIAGGSIAYLAAERWRRLWSDASHDASHDDMRGGP
jgi:predicted branched-subunit amino acid permease